MLSENTRPTPFLSLVAHDLIQRFSYNLSEIVVVFPGIRASLFFNQYLYQQARQPLWAPQYRSIESLFEGATELRKGDTIQLIAELYESYTQVYNAHNPEPSKESLDEFFFFGEILLNDFDDLDKNLVDAQALFGNLQDLDALRDNFSHLSEVQIEAIRHHLNAFHGDSALKNAFRNIWTLLGEVYTVFKNRLTTQNTAYPGMLMRRVVENEATSFPAKHYVFVGFNVLSRCEEVLFKQMKPKASFYWDYDEYYLHTEAGRFIQNNIRKFGSVLDNSLFDTFLQTEKKITFLACPSDSGQAATIAPWIDSLGKEPSFTQADSAIVLCNENLLPTVMHAISPEKTENVNITMGFPIMQTAICSFLQVLAEMQTKAFRATDQSFWYRYVLPVLRHPYTSYIFQEAKAIENELIKNNIFYPSTDELKDSSIFSYAETTVDLAKYLLEIIQKVGQSYENEPENTYTGLYQESVFRAYQTVNRLYGLLSTGKLQLEKPTFLRLLRKLLSTVQIPFHGEPVKGLQIMGVLETRTLDFDNLLIFNMNEGFMPGSNNDNTFVPQFLRSHVGMSTIDHQDSIFAYYFYRLIQRAKNITLVYTTDKQQTGKAEMSRFLLQLLTDPKLNGKIERFALQSDIQPFQSEAISIEKDKDLIERIKQQYDLNTNPDAYRLSPTAINTYINCNYKFYLEYILGQRNKEELADELDNSVFGSIFHCAAEYLYKEIIANHPLPFTVQKEHISEYQKYPNKIEGIVLQAFEKEYFKNRQVDKSDFNGEQLINFYVIYKLLERLLQFDRQRAPFTIFGLEHPVKEEFTLSEQNIRLHIGGIIDRLEEKDGTRIIIDYKTGGKPKEIKTLEELFTAKANRAAHIFQTFVYASTLLQRPDFQHPIAPALLYIQQANKDDYSPAIQYNKEILSDFRELNADFQLLLTNLIGEIFDSSTPFRQTEIAENCRYCDFRAMCNREF
ncbi:MAG: PD-(D/E)XK nuclease family protein [Candidatus Symbiothrix sp.]|jgi:CRISPR/Cas system-associated exonuclease Cas4 (RecB family)|nr:PD-(D/E)XK nuclease family protein [Candidatus Symbiothrix sp.]